MANRMWSQFNLSSVKGLVGVYAQVAFAATGAPTLLAYASSTGTFPAAPSSGFVGSASITRNGVGDYTLKLQDSYLRLLSFGLTFIGSGNAVGPIYQVNARANPNAAGATAGDGFADTNRNSVRFFTFSAAGTKADPAATELGVFEIMLQNSGAV